MDAAWIQNKLLTVPGILIALTIHEYAHGWMARLRGDNTAYLNGRLTLNPIVHLDLFGTLLLFFGPFGWAKPVPVNARNLFNPRWDMVLVSLAGPVSNVILAILFGVVYTVGRAHVPAFSQLPFYAENMISNAIIINLGISFFNLIPIPPLDGSHILMGFLSPKQNQTYIRIMQRAPLVLFALITIEWLFHIPTISLVLYPLFEPYQQFWFFIINFLSSVI